MIFGANRGAAVAPVQGHGRAVRRLAEEPGDGQAARTEDDSRRLRHENGRSLPQPLFQLIKGIVVSEADGMRFATNPDSLQMNLRGIFLDEGRKILSSL